MLLSTNTEHTYKENDGKKDTLFTLTTEINSEFCNIETKQDEMQINSRCNLDGETISWVLKHGKTSLVAKSADNKISLTGELNGEKVNKTYDMKTNKWMQMLSVSLKNFVLSEDKTISFMMINPKNLKSYEMSAEKIVEEQLLINEKMIDTVKLKISPKGFFASFWHGNYWFDKNSGLFLKYHASNGVPGSGETLIILTK